ncbi:MAG TPA: hypothetical protein VK638_36270 [Edaphobacter sp.]|nr:hypothetical protein [Edaphobacter sp.]
MPFDGVLNPGYKPCFGTHITHRGRTLSMSQMASEEALRETFEQEDLSGPPAANRHRLPVERVGITHHFSIAGHEGYLTIDLYPNGQPGESSPRSLET